MKVGLEFLYPYIDNKEAWPYEHDILYWENWPVRQASLVLGAMAFGEKRFLKTWMSLEADPEIQEVQRNLILRYPVLWLSD